MLVVMKSVRKKADFFCLDKPSKRLECDIKT